MTPQGWADLGGREADLWRLKGGSGDSHFIWLDIWRDVEEEPVDERPKVGAKR